MLLLPDQCALPLLDEVERKFGHMAGFGDVCSTSTI
jgi:hypothetical protein